jgi:hypothetical protein
MIGCGVFCWFHLDAARLAEEVFLGKGADVSVHKCVCGALRRNVSLPHASAARYAGFSMTKVDHCGFWTAKHSKREQRLIEEKLHYNLYIAK